MGLHNLTTDEWAESISPSAVFEETSIPDDDDQGEILSEEDQRIQREKINLDLKRLETFLENFDYFSGKSILDRHKLRFHADYLKARAIYYDNIMVFPDLNKIQSNQIAETPDQTTVASSEENKDGQTSDATKSSTTGRHDPNQRWKQKIKEDAKKEQLMELFYRVYEELQKL